MARCIHCERHLKTGARVWAYIPYDEVGPVYLCSQACNDQARATDALEVWELDIADWFQAEIGPILESYEGSLHSADDVERMCESVQDALEAVWNLPLTVTIDPDESSSGLRIRVAERVSTSLLS